MCCRFQNLGFLSCLGGLGSFDGFSSSHSGGFQTALAISMVLVVARCPNLIFSKTLNCCPKGTCLTSGMLGPNNLNYMVDMMQKQWAAHISEFEISHDSNTRTWNVVGEGLQRFVQMTSWRHKILTEDFNMFWRHLVLINPS